MTPIVLMRAALRDKDLFGPLLAGNSWAAWRVMLIAIMGEELTREERRIFKSLTKRAREPLQIAEAFVAVVGRRGGKSRAMSVLAAFIAALCDHKDKVVPGERPLVLCLAQNQKQAGVVFGYVAAVFETVAALRRMVVNRTSDSLTLSNGVSIEVRPASFRGLRGVTALAVLADETCFWYSEETSKNADSEILNAVRPSLATTGGPLIMISSPYAKRGETWELYRRHFGQNGDPLILVAQGASRDFNPSLPQRVVDRALEADPDAAAAEYLGQWRNDIAAFVSREVVEACVSPDIFERPPLGDVSYFGFVDPSGGSSDSMTAAVAHREGEIVILDAVREHKPPFSRESVTQELAAFFKSYRVLSIRGDRYGGEWPREAFRKHGVEYLIAEKNRSELYFALLPLLNSRRIDLLDSKRLTAQLCGLERRTARGGRDSIDHAQGQHDDLANAVAGVVIMANERRPTVPFVVPYVTSRASSFLSFGGDYSAEERAYGDRRQEGFTIRRA